ncbi:MAG: hypothetical protein ACXVAD_03585 [Syntrophales bacterium]
MNPDTELILYKIGWPLDDFIRLFDPSESADNVTNQELIEALPRFFSAQGLRSEAPGYPVRITYDTKARETFQILQPYEHVLVVDLRKRDTQLTEEFERYIKQQREYQKKIKQKRKMQSAYKNDHTYLSWEPTTKRERNETEAQLKIWDMRKGKSKKTFAQIAKQLNILEDTTKKRFYAAWEKTQGRPYDACEYLERIKNDPIKCPDLYLI